MVTIRLEFPAGRYHATPYGRHVNEGVPEWPPSIYRLLRALYDVWQRKCPDIPAVDIERLFTTLAESLPHYRLPGASASHTRSYLSANTEDPSDKNLVFDGFLIFDRNARCYISWPDLILPAADQAVLHRLLQNLNYLGRSESWIRAGLHDAGASNGTSDALFPCLPLDQANGSGEAVAVACALGPSGYAGKRPWMDALASSTTEVLAMRESAPPLLRQVPYLRPAGAIDTNPVQRPLRRRAPVNAVMLVLDSTVLPLVTSTLDVAERIRTCLMGAHRKRMGDDPTKVSARFSGKENGAKRLDHGHVYILPLSREQPKDRIDRVLIYTTGPSTWSPEELSAVLGVRRLWQADNRPDVNCALAWQGLLGNEPRIWRKSRTVVSATPFVPPRHMRKGRDFSKFLFDEVHRECRNHSLPEPASITLLEDGIPHSPFECVEYRRNRKSDPVMPGYSLRLTFENPVAAPFAIGYGAHFGLGQFTAG